MMPLYDWNAVMLLACAAFFYKAADVENAPPFLWPGLSILTYLFTWFFLRWHIPGNLFGQLILLAAITVARVVRDKGGPRT